MKRFLNWLFLLGWLGSSVGAAEADSNNWASVVLWRNKVLSAKLRFMRSASLADRYWLAVEFDNHTGKPLKIDQAWLQLEGERKSPSTGKVVLSGGIAGGHDFFNALAPGITTITGHMDHPNINMCHSSLDLPPREGFHVEAIVKADANLANGKTVATPENGVPIRFEWRYPNADEVESMRRELRRSMPNSDQDGERGGRWTTLLRAEVVAEALSLEELLTALKRREDNIGGRQELSWEVARRFSNSPPVVAYYREALKGKRSEAWRDHVDPAVWKSAFAAPLIARYEASDDWVWMTDFEIHRKEWITNQSYVARLSAAFLKRQPILQESVERLSGERLSQWCRAADEAGVVGDTNLVRLLAPALTDKRADNVDNGAGGRSEDRVCDHALSAVLKLFEGKHRPDYKEAGFTEERWSRKEYQAANDRLIAALKTWLQSPAVE